VQHNGGVRLTDGADGDPPYGLVADVEADLETEHVAVERERRLGVEVGQEAGVDAETGTWIAHTAETTVPLMCPLLDS